MNPDSLTFKWDSRLVLLHVRRVDRRRGSLPFPPDHIRVCLPFHREYAAEQTLPARSRHDVAFGHILSQGAESAFRAFETGFSSLCPRPCPRGALGAFLRSQYAGSIPQLQSQ